MKKFYEQPVMRINAFELENILTASSSDLKSIMGEDKNISNVQTVSAETILEFVNK